MKIIVACRDRFFLRFQPEKVAEGLLLFIQGLGLGKTSILCFLWNKFRLGQTILKLNDSFKAKLIYWFQVLLRMKLRPKASWKCVTTDSWKYWYNRQEKTCWNMQQTKCKRTHLINYFPFHCNRIFKERTSAEVCKWSVTLFLCLVQVADLARRLWHLVKLNCLFLFSANSAHALNVSNQFYVIHWI